MSKSLLSINKAAALLGVSAKTLRRWEEKGKLIPQRTLGNQRRYALSDIKNLKSLVKTNTPQISPKKNSTSSQAPASVQTPVSRVEEQEEVVTESKSNFIPETSKKPTTTGHFIPLHFSRALIHLPMIIVSLFASLLVIGGVNFYLANQDSSPFNRQKIIKALSLLHSNNDKKGNKTIFGQEVLQAATQKHDFALRVNVPAEFMSTATVAGTLTAPNILYGLVAGNNITISGDLQNPTISATSSGGVLTLQGQSGSLQLTAGDGISIDGLTITNDDPGSDQDIFANIKVGSSTISAGGNSDTLELIAGSGVTLTANTSSKTVTINSSGLSGLTTNGVLYADSSTTATSLTPGTSGYILQSNGSGSPPSWVANGSSSNPSFSVITDGTNTSAAMVVGSGASLTYSGGTATSGVINANQLLGGTWAIPGSIGATTPNAGAFTTLSGSSTITFSGFTSNGGPLYTNGTGTVAQATAGSATQVLHGGTTPSFSAVSLTADVSGILPLANGGTNANLSAVQGGIVYSGATAMAISAAGTSGQAFISGGTGTPTWFAPTAGSVLFAGTSGILQQDNSSFFFDDTNNRLGIGTNSNLAGTLDVRGTSGTIPVASVAGQTSFASLLVDNSGAGDLFTASKSGAPKFTILNNGNISWAGTGNFQTILTTAGTATQTINIPDTAGTGGTFCLTTGNCAGVGGTGDVLGPGSSTDNALVRFNGTTGKSIQNSGIIIDDSNNVTGVNSLTIAPATDITALTLTGTNVTTQKLAYLNAKNVSGTIFDISYGATQTLTGSLIGQAIDLNNGQVTATNQNVTVEKMTLPTITNTITSGTKSLLGLQVTFGSGSGIEQNGSGGTTVYSALDVILPALTQTAGTLTANGLAVTLPTGITTAGTANGILLTPTGVGAGSLNGINIGNITAGAGTERAISIGSGWDNVLTVNGTSIINGSGVTQVAGGGTGLASYATGDLIYASGTTTLAARNIGNTGEVLTVSGGLPVWSTITGSSCTNCLINNPTSDQAISPTGQATTGLTVRQTSTASPTDDIFQVTDSTGSTKYFYVDNAGNVSTGAISNTTLTLTPTTNTTALTLVGTNVTTATNQYINTNNTSGTIVNLAYGAAQTLSTTLTTTGINVDLSTNVTATEANVTGENITLPAETNAHTSGTKTVKGVNVTSGGGLSQTGAGGTTNWSAFDATIPALTQSAGTLNAYGVNVTTPSSITTGGTAAALNINGSGVGAGSLYGLNISSITAGAGTETAINIGSGWDTDINATTSLEVGIGGTNELVLSATNLNPGADGGNSLGASGTEWQNLFLNTGAVINFEASDVTLTHSANLLTMAGGDLTLGGNLAVNGGSITSTGSLTLTPTTTLSLNSTGDMTLDSSTDIILDADGADIFFKDATTTFATFTNSSTDLTLDIAGGDLIFADGDVFSVGQTSYTDVAYNVIGDTVSGADASLDSDDDLFIEGNLQVLGNIISPTTGTSGYWQRNLGALAPSNITDDLLVGGSATSSATFHVFGAANLQGTSPVATISANTSFAGLVVDNRGAGDLFTASSSGLNRFVIKQNGNVGIGTTLPTAMLDVAGTASISSSLNFRTGAGAIQTTANNTLTLGGDTTGTIVLLPLNGGGRVGIGTAPPVNTLSVDGKIGVYSNNEILFYTDSGSTQGGMVGLGRSNEMTLVGNVASSMLRIGAATSGSIGFWANGQAEADDAPQMLFTSNGYLGIGGSPTAANVLGTLDVKGMSDTLAVASVSGKSNSFAAMVVDNRGAGDIFTASRSGRPAFTVMQERVQIGTGSAGAYNPQFLALDVKENGGDPTGGNEGYMYYNTSTNKFRCYQGTAWTDCVGVSAAEYLRAEMRTDQTTNFTADSDHLKMNTVDSSSGSSITLDTTTTYTNGAGASIGRYTLAAGKTYVLRASIPDVSFTNGGNGFLGYRWYNLTGAAYIGNNSIIVSSEYAASPDGGFGSYAEAVITPAVSTVVELRISLSGAITAIGSSGGSRYPNSFIQVISDGTGVGQFTGASSTTDGVMGLVPAPVAGEQGSVLMGDGDWSDPTRFSLSRLDTLSVASVSGKSNSFAAMVVDNRGTGDIFTASSSGLNRFVIKNNGNVGIGTANPTSTLSLFDTNGPSLRMESGANADSEVRFAENGSSIFRFLYNGSAGANPGNLFKIQASSGGNGTWDRDSFTLTQSGTIGVHSTTPLSTFDIRNISDTISVASVSGKSNSFAAMVVDNRGTGDIFTASSSGLNRFVIKNNGNVGIGTANPAIVSGTTNKLLEIAGTVAPGIAIRDTADDGQMFIYLNESDNSLNIQNASGTDLLTISSTGSTDVNGTLTIDTAADDNERLCHSGADGTTLTGIVIRDCTVVGEDFAEFAIIQDAQAEPGDVVSTVGPDSSNPNLIVKKLTTSAYEHHSGVISTNPFIDTLGDEQYKGKNGARPIALAGRVPVKVSLENGVVKTGDPLVPSSIPGVAMKAKKASYVIGFAQEDYDGSIRISSQVLDQERIYNSDLDDRQAFNSNPDSWSAGTGKIIAEYKPTWYDPDIYLTDSGNINIFEDGTDPVNGNTLFGVKDENDQEIKRVGVFSDAAIGNLKSGNIDTQKLILAGQDVNERLSLLEQQATGSGQFTNQSSDLQNSILSLSDRVASVEATLNLANIFNFTASSSSELNLDSLNVIGRTLLSDVGITGRVNIGLLSIDGLDNNGSAAINTTAGPLMLQSLGLNGVDILNGKVAIDPDGNVNIKETLTAKVVKTTKLDIIDDPTSTTSATLSSSAGSVIIDAGNTSIDVDTTALTANSLIFVTPDQPVIIGAKKKDSDTFTIKLQQSQTNNIKVNWWIVN